MTRPIVAEQISIARHYTSLVIRAANDEDRRKARLTAVVAWEAVAQRLAVRPRLVDARAPQPDRFMADLWLDLREPQRA